MMNDAERAGKVGRYSVAALGVQHGIEYDLWRVHGQQPISDAARYCPGIPLALALRLGSKAIIRST
jgi:hypothetical protein